MKIMKKILLIAFLFVSILGYSQNNVKDIKIRNSLTLQDSNVTNITTGDTLTTKKWTIANAAILTGNPTEIFFNSGGILGSSPRFTYNPADSTVTVDSLELANGERISWNTDEYTINIPTGLGPVLQTGQELYIIIYNNTGSTLTNMTVLRPVAAVDIGGFLAPTVERAIANVHTGIEGTIMISTMDIPDGTVGIATRFGRVRGVNTSGFSPGDDLFISAVDSGVVVNVRPEFPNYEISLGGALNSASAPDGQIIVSVTRDFTYTFNNFWNGVLRETFDFLVTESGGIITGTLTPSNGHPDMTMMFSDGFTMLDTDPGITIVLTAGTDVNPQTNYVYIPETTKVLTVSTSEWPTIEHIKVSQLFLQSATTTGTDGALRNQNWNDHIESTTTFQGHLSHITEKLRQFEAQWDNGIEGTSTIDAGPTPDDVWASNTSGEVYQLHKQPFSAFDTEAGSDLHIVNHSSTPYTIVTNLNTQILDASGNSLNNTSFSFVMWGVANKSGDSSHVMINLPTDAYAFASPANAVSDALNYSVYTIPKPFQGVGFLIARFTYTYKNDDWVLFDTEDLRGKIPNTTAGGGAGGVGITTFLGLTDTESSYTAYEFQVANAGGTALESPSGLTYNDSLTLVGDFNADTITADEAIGIGTRHPSYALDVQFNTIRVGDFIPLNPHKSGEMVIPHRTSGEEDILVFRGLSLNTPQTRLDFGGGTNTYNSAQEIRFYTGSTEITTAGVKRMWIESDGDINLGVVAKTKENVTEQFIINPQGDLTGTLAAPNWSFGDGDTGGTEFVDDELSLITNSIEAMRLTEDTVFIDSIGKFGKDLYVAGNVGIGTINPSHTLTVEKPVDADNLVTINNTSVNQGAGLKVLTADGGATALRYALLINDDFIVQNGGNIGINDVTPSFKLDVNGTGRFTGIVNFDVFPITPSSAPTTDYQIANKKYVDDQTGSGTKYLGINSSGFTSVNPDIDDVNITTSAFQITTGTVNARANVNLPHGAVVTSVIVTGNVSTRNWSLDRSTNGTTSGSSVMATAVLNTADNSIITATIDNSSYTYVISVSLIASGEDVYDATITYTL